MKKLILLFFFQILNAQDVQDFYFPKNYQKIADAKGDLDKDGKDETAIVFLTDIKAENGFKKELYILKEINGKLKVWKKNRSVLFDSGIGFYSSDCYVKLNIKNNCLIVEQNYFASSRNEEVYKSTFRFQNNDWYLIGSRLIMNRNCEYSYTYDINFSIKKILVKEVYEDCEEIENKIIPKNFKGEFTLPMKNIPKIDGFVIGVNKIKIKKYKMPVYY